MELKADHMELETGESRVGGRNGSENALESAVVGSEIQAHMLDGMGCFGSVSRLLTDVAGEIWVSHRNRLQTMALYRSLDRDILFGREIFAK